MRLTKRHLGAEAEAKACQYLQDQGLRLLEKNYYCAAGEIDLIMEHDKTIVFVEVRMRNNPSFGSAAESVDWRKQKKLNTTALHYLQNKPKQAKRPARFDVIAMNQNSQTPIQWIKDAFGA